MKTVLVLIFSVLSLTCSYAQIRFEKGYFIDNDGTKTECLIRNADWRKNPASVEYKIDEAANPQTITAEMVKEFGVYNSSKYISRKVLIDRSSSQLSELTMSPDPVFREETLFLKSLIEGQANLYYYESRNLKRFFYNVNGSPIEQLVFKVYKHSSNRVNENNKFRQQLANSLNCSSIEKSKLAELRYQKKVLIDIFSEYNLCVGSDIKNYVKEKAQRDVFTVNLRPRLNYTSLSAKNPIDISNKFDWGNKASFGFGVEGEVFLASNKNKWAVLLEPTFQSFSGRTSSPELFSTPGATRVATVEYKSIEIPIGIRHYFFLNSDYRVFVNASFLFDVIAANSEMDVTRANGYPVSHLTVSGGTNLAFGAGLKYKAFGIEARYQTPRDPLNNYAVWSAEYKQISFVLSYLIFTKRS